MIISYLIYTGTHGIRDVSIEGIAQNTLLIQYAQSSHVVEEVKPFVALLYCESETCTVFNFTSSLYLSLHKESPKNYSLMYESGYYLMFVFDADENGSVIPSEGNRAFSKSGQRLQLDDGVLSKK